MPNCEKIGYKLKNEDQVQSLGVILTLWKMQTPTLHSDHRRRKPGFLISHSVSISPPRVCATEEEFEGNVRFKSDSLVAGVKSPW